VQFDKLQEPIAAFELNRVLISYYLADDEEESGEDPVCHEEKLFEIRF
jgi:hypothetical protein